MLFFFKHTIRVCIHCIYNIHNFRNILNRLSICIYIFFKHKRIICVKAKRSYMYSDVCVLCVCCVFVFSKRSAQFEFIFWVNIRHINKVNFMFHHNTICEMFPQGYFVQTGAPRYYNIECVYLSRFSIIYRDYMYISNLVCICIYFNEKISVCVFFFYLFIFFIYFSGWNTIRLSMILLSLYTKCIFIFYFEHTCFYDKRI